MSLFIAILVSAGCHTEQPDQSSEIPEVDLVSILKLAKADDLSASVLPVGFPAVQDLAVLYPLETEHGIKASGTTKSGQALLSETWLNTVSEAYYETDVEDALEVENSYEDWRVVSLRLVPCGPLGIRPDQQIAELCWPQIRLVWQPIVENIYIIWEHRDYYADDRAIHALYHVMPEDSYGEEVINSVADFLKTGADPNDLDPALRSLFLQKRDAALSRLIQAMLYLRGNEPAELLKVLDIRSELQSLSDDPEAESLAFTERLHTVLASICEPEHLFELTSFSLPEGRLPAQINSWTFIAFDGEQGELIQKPITVIGKNSGAVIGHAGFDETVAMGSFDEELVESLDNPIYASELEASVPFSSDDVEAMSEVINDGQQTLIPNTSCATCHRYNPLTFDFHNLSHLEDTLTTVSPRVHKDVEYDQNWLNERLGL